MTASVPYEILTLTYAKHVKRVFFCTILCLRVSLCKFFFPSEFFSVGNYVGSIYYVVPRHFDNLSDYFLIPSSLFLSLSLSLSEIWLNRNYLIKCKERKIQSWKKRKTNAFSFETILECRPTLNLTWHFPTHLETGNFLVGMIFSNLPNIQPLPSFCFLGYELIFAMFVLDLGLIVLWKKQEREPCCGINICHSSNDDLRWPDYILTTFMGWSSRTFDLLF